MTSPFALRELAEYLNADLQGDPGVVIRRLNTLRDAKEGELAFLASRAYRQQLQDTRASAVILSPAEAAGYRGNALVHPNPYLAYARVSSLFGALPTAAAGVHPSAVVAIDAVLDPTAVIGPHAVIEAGARIGSGAVVGAGCFIGADTLIGDGCLLHPNVTVYHGVSIGRRAVIHSGTVIGADGFGFANDGGRWVKIHQLGGVEIGASTTIDRGALGDTVIGNGVIIDNLVQIAHNVRIGDYSALAGCAAIAGSTVVGRHCVLAGGAGLVGHIELCDGVTVTARSMITRSIGKPGTYSSGTPFDDNRVWRRNAIRFGQLDDLARRVQDLEKQHKR